MVYINASGYIERKSSIGRRRKNYKGRDWWLVKCGSEGSSGVISLKSIVFPKSLVGEKVRFKVEVIGDDYEELIFDG